MYSQDRECENLGSQGYRQEPAEIIVKELYLLQSGRQQENSGGRPIAQLPPGLAKHQRVDQKRDEPGKRQGIQRIGPPVEKPSGHQRHGHQDRPKDGTPQPEKCGKKDKKRQAQSAAKADRYPQAGKQTPATPQPETNVQAGNGNEVIQAGPAKILLVLWRNSSPLTQEDCFQKPQGFR